ncbi:MAG: FHA domain-containing protein [Pseudomonadota bacterium]
MKLIRTLIENRSGEDKVAPAAKLPIPPMPRPRRTATAPGALRARSVLSDGLDRKMKAFKSDLADLAPLPKSGENGKTSKRVWDIVDKPESDAQETLADLGPDEVCTQPLPEESEEEQAPAVKRAGRKASALRLFEVPPPVQPRRPLTIGRKKTRIMGFGGDDEPNDLFDISAEETAVGLEFLVGWLVIIEGHGQGTAFVLQNPVSSIGRGQGQTIMLNYGDDTISRSNHAAIAYDDQMNACFLGFGGKANLVRLNGRPVLGTEQLNHGDVIRVGETKLKYIALCGPDFSWQDEGEV